MLFVLLKKNVNCLSLSSTQRLSESHETSQLCFPDDFAHDYKPLSLHSRQVLTPVNVFLEGLGHQDIVWTVFSCTYLHLKQRTIRH